jgi:hypothetical protein
MRTLLPLLLAASIVHACQFGAVRSVPFDDAWIPESYLAGIDGSQSGARGVTSVRPSGIMLGVQFRLVGGDPNLAQGEILRYLEDLSGCGRLVDLVGASITLQLDAPTPLRMRPDGQGIAGVQIIVETENRDGVVARQYSAWSDVGTSPTQTVTFAPTALSTATSGFTDVFLDLERSTKIGVKLALNDRSAGEYAGTWTIRRLTITFPARATHDTLIRQMRQKFPAVPDSTPLSRLPDLPPSPADAQVIAVSDSLRARSASVQQIRVVGGTERFAGKAWEVGFAFPLPPSGQDVQPARLAMVLEKLLDLRGRKVVTHVAVSTGLRGYITRPNQVQIELFDSEQRVLRAAALNVSTQAIEFDDNGLERASRWMRVEAFPISGAPLAMGYLQPGFRADQVQQIGVRFLIGHASHLLRRDSAPIQGKLFLSEFRVEADREPQSFPQAVRSSRTLSDIQVAPQSSAALIGINYPWNNYGWDVGKAPFGGREIGGFSAYRAKLRRDFALLRKSGVRVVRVFLLCDARAGLVLGPNGLVQALDSYVLRDLDALTDAAAEHELLLVPVLVDFLIADGQLDRQYGPKRWKEGEAPHLLIDPAARSAFIENALKPIVRRLDETNKKKEVVWATDIANEIENAVGLQRNFPQVREFAREVFEMIKRETSLKVTIGSRDRDDLAAYWADFVDWDILQYHVYDKGELEENRSFYYPASNFGISKPVILGELEPSSAIPIKLDGARALKYAAAMLWSFRGDDGFVVDLDGLRRWVEQSKPNVP